MLKQQMPRLALSAAVLISPWAWSQSAEWLYMSSGQSWVQHSLNVPAYPFEIELPSQAQTLWWQPLAADLRVQRLQSPGQEHLRPGVHLKSRSAVSETRYEVLQVLESSILARELNSGTTEAVLIPMTQFAQYRVMTERGANDRLRFESQEAAGPRRYAYASSDLQAQLSYQLLLAEDESASLVQLLSLSNHGDAAVASQGLSYQPTMSGGHMPRMAMMAETSSLDMARPQEALAGYQRLVQYPHPIELPAQSETHLSISMQPVQQQHHFTSQWYGQVVQAQAAQWRLQLTSGQDLPRLAGPIQLAWFDLEQAQLSSYYQPSSAEQTELQLGSNAQVNYSTEQAADGSWVLSMVNNLQQDVAFELQLNHRHSDRVQHQRTLSLTLVPGTTRYRLSLDAQGIDYRPYTGN